MLLIVMHHWFVHGIGVDFALFTSRELIFQTFEIFGKIGVDIYILISGYYLINGQFRWSRFWSLLIQTLVFSLLMTIAALGVAYVFGERFTAIKVAILQIVVGAVVYGVCLLCFHEEMSLGYFQVIRNKLFHPRKQK